MQSVGGAETYQKRIHQRPLDRFSFLRTTCQPSDVFREVKSVVLEPVSFRQVQNVRVVALIMRMLLALKAQQQARKITI